MTRSFGPLDAIVAIGLCATVLGGGVLFVAANGTLHIPTLEARPVEQPMNSVSETGWLQPVLGQAIVESSFIEKQAAESIPAAGAKLNQAVLADQWLQQSARGYAASIETSAQQVEVEHAGRIQAVMGHSLHGSSERPRWPGARGVPAPRVACFRGNRAPTRHTPSLLPKCRQRSQSAAYVSQLWSVRM